MLPGQTVHIHAGLKGDATYRFDSDMRVTELRHIINMQGYKTSLKLTDDVTNSKAFSFPDSYSLLKEHAGALMQGKANDLKASGVDVLIPRFSKSY
jgi:hypothetical protein